MKRKIYGVMNLSFGNPRRKEDYLLVREKSRHDTFRLPDAIEDFGYLYPVDHVKFIAGDSSLIEGEQYTIMEINQKVDEMANEVEQYLADLLRSGKKGEVDTSPSLYGNTMILEFIPMLT